MVDQDKTDRGDEVLEEADKLAGVHKDPLGAPFSSGTSRRSRSEKKPRFSLRGYNFPPLDLKTDLCVGCQEGTSGQPKTKNVETVMDECLENTEEEAEDLQQEMAFATHKMNASVSELLEDLQGRSGSSVRTPVLQHKHAPDTATRDQGVSSEVPQTKAIQTRMAELLGDTKEDTDELPSEFAQRTNKTNISVTELLEDLQGRSGSYLRTAALHQHVPDTAIRDQEVSFGVPPTKASETLMTELLGNTNEDNEDTPPEFAQPTKKANISVAEFLEDLQGRSGSSFRTAALQHQHALNTAIREQEVSSGLPRTKASETLIAELLGKTKEDTGDIPSESAGPTKKANISIAELLEDLRGRSDSSFKLHQHPRAKDHMPKLSTSGKKTLAILDERSHDSDDPLEISSEEEEVIQNYLTLVNKDVKQQTMTDLFQEIFDPANMEGTTLPVRSFRSGYCRRMQRIVQVEKHRHAEFLRQYHREQGGSKGITVKIMSRSLEGKLAVCSCLLQETSNLTLTSNASTDQAMDENKAKKTIIFSPKICDNVDLLVGNMVHIFPPWKEVTVQEENVILCTYFLHHGAQ